MLDRGNLKNIFPARGGALITVSGGPDMAGWVISGYFKKCYRYESEYDLLRALEGLCDGMGFPLAAFGDRSFGTRQKKLRGRKAEKYEEGELEGRMEKEKATFIVNIMFRKNASFQGSITWVEKEKTQHFRSAFEMLKLMDEARRDAPGEPACWEEVPDAEK